MVAFAVMFSGLTSAATLARGFGGDYLAVFVDLPVVLVGLIFILVSGSSASAVSRTACGWRLG